MTQLRTRMALSVLILMANTIVTWNFKIFNIRVPEDIPLEKYQLMMDLVTNRTTVDREEKGKGMTDGSFLSLKRNSPAIVEAAVSGNVSLGCSAVGSPAPLVYWLKDGRPLAARDWGTAGSSEAGQWAEGRKFSESMSDSNSEIQLDCLDKEDAGVYTCVALSGETIKKANFSLHLVDVASGSTGRTECDRFSKAPRIHQWMSGYMQLIGKDARLTCRATGPHKTRWIDSRENAVELTSGKYQVTPEGDLVIRALTFVDMGLFKCTVMNPAGMTDWKETFVYPITEA